MHVSEICGRGRIAATEYVSPPNISQLSKQVMKSSRNILLLSLALAAIQQSVIQADFPQKLANVEDNNINESSGIAISYTLDNAVWIHNDSGDKARLYLVGFDGETKAVVDVKDADAHDWEDMCSFRIDGKSWLLIGDIGDNSKRRGDKDPDCRLHLIQEPNIKTLGSKLSVPIHTTMKFKYEDGIWDCEGLAVDSERKEILLLTKDLPHKCGLYVMPLDIHDAKQKLTARRIASPYIPYATALDISPSGHILVVGTMLNALAVKRTRAQSWEEAFRVAGTAFSLPPRKQGETICFDRTGKWLFVNSEGAKQPLWRLPVPE